MKKLLGILCSVGILGALGLWASGPAPVAPGVTLVPDRPAAQATAARADPAGDTPRPDPVAATSVPAREAPAPESLRSAVEDALRRQDVQSAKLHMQDAAPRLSNAYEPVISLSAERTFTPAEITAALAERDRLANQVNGANPAATAVIPKRDENKSGGNAR